MGRLSFVLISLLAACGGDDGGSNMPMIDAPMNNAIVPVDPCPGGEAATFTTMATAFSPTTAQITMGQVVKFVSTATHPIASNGAATPTILAVPEGQTKCFRFVNTGTFGFRCTVHGYAGTVTVN